MSFNINMMKNGEQIWIAYKDGECSWSYNDQRIVLPKFNCKDHGITLAIGTDCVVVNGVHENRPFRPYDLEVYDFQGNYLWNVGDIARTISPRNDAFYFVEILSKSTLLRPPWRALFGSCTLEDDHEYLTAYDGGEQWLFDITDRKFVKRVFTH